jgi:hypothetical protein
MYNSIFDYLEMSVVYFGDEVLDLIEDGRIADSIKLQARAQEMKRLAADSETDIELLIREEFNTPFCETIIGAYYSLTGDK